MLASVTSVGILVLLDTLDFVSTFLNWVLKSFEIFNFVFEWWGGIRWRGL
jgi:hypothetical protein